MTKNCSQCGQENDAAAAKCVCGRDLTAAAFNPVQTSTADMQDNSTAAMRSFAAASRTDDLVAVEVPEDSAGARAGLRPGDVIEEYDFQKVKGSLNNFMSLLPRTAGRDKVRMLIYRDNRPMTLDVPGGGLRIRVVETRAASQGTMNRTQVVGGAVALVAGVVVFAIGQSIYGRGHDVAMYESIRRGEALMSLGNIIRFTGIGAAAIGAIVALVNFLKAGAQQASAATPQSAWTDGPPPREEQRGTGSSPVPVAASPQSGGDELRKCPFCAEMIRKEAIRCRFCQSDVSAGALAK